MTNRVAALSVTVVTVVASGASASGPLQFPQSFEQGVHYATVERGNIREELYTSGPAIEAAKKGAPFPDGTVNTLVDHRDGKLYRYVVMEKRHGSGAEYPPDVRNGDWKYQEFTAEKSVNSSEDGTRCMRCHMSQERDDFVFTANRMKSVK